MLIMLDLEWFLEKTSELTKLLTLCCKGTNYYCLKRTLPFCSLKLVFYKKKDVNRNLFTHEALRSYLQRVRLKVSFRLEVLVFEDRGKPDYPQKNLW